MARLMLYTPRTIALLAELYHPPMMPDPAPIQRVHNQLYRDGDPPYSSFQVTNGGAVLSNPVQSPGASSLAAFLPDRFQFREELSSLTHDDFAARVRKVSAQVSAARRVPLFTSMHVTLRTLVNPRSYKDSRAYLKHGMFGFDDEMEAFGREPALLGIRLVFPAAEGHPESHSLRIESFSSDARSLFIEIVSSFGPIVPNNGLAEVEANILTSYRFITEQTMRFIGGFDTAGVEPEEEE
ncbi:MAG: hypothetical protein SGI72_16320 [Planctomycetota bacterium]|nr:hypothetical protein [Planctomycetota bacterium]